MMDNDNLLPDILPEDALLEREERCRKALRTLGKAIFMRLFVAVVLFWAAFRDGMALWAMGLMGLVLLINLSSLLPLWKEWRKRRMELKEIIAKFK